MGLADGVIAGVEADDETRDPEVTAEVEVLPEVVLVAISYVSSFRIESNPLHYKTLTKQRCKAVSSSDTSQASGVESLTALLKRPLIAQPFGVLTYTYGLPSIRNSQQGLHIQR